MSTRHGGCKEEEGKDRSLASAGTDDGAQAVDAGRDDLVGDVEDAKEEDLAGDVRGMSGGMACNIGVLEEGGGPGLLGDDVTNAAATQKRSSCHRPGKNSPHEGGGLYCMKKHPQATGDAVAGGGEQTDHAPLHAQSWRRQRETLPPPPGPCQGEKRKQRGARCVVGDQVPRRPRRRRQGREQQSNGDQGET